MSPRPMMSSAPRNSLSALKAVTFPVAFPAGGLPLAIVLLQGNPADDRGNEVVWFGSATILRLCVGLHRTDDEPWESPERDHVANALVPIVSLFPHALGLEDQFDVAAQDRKPVAVSHAVATRRIHA